MATTIKGISQQKLYQILQNCKQIPKDDRLTLRKMLRQGDTELIAILSDFNNKKLQIRLRKHFQKYKENKNQSDLCRKNAIKEPPVSSYYREAMKSMEKDRRRRRDSGAGQGMGLVDKCRSLSSSKFELFKEKPFTTAFGESSNLQNQPIVIISGKYTYEDNYLKQSQSNTSSMPDFTKWDSLRTLASPVSYQQPSMRNSLMMTPSILRNPINEESDFSSIYQRIRCSLPGLPCHPRQSKNPQKDMYTLKSSLIKYYAQDIFEHIINLHFPLNLTLTQKSVYLPYREFLVQLQIYLHSKGQPINIIKQNESQIPILEPFKNQYEGVSIKNIGIFLDAYCLRRNNQVRNIFIVLGSGQDQAVCLDKFRRINAWKGEQLTGLFQEIVSKWGDCDCITYWQVYRVRKEKLFLNFQALYDRN